MSNLLGSLFSRREAATVPSMDGVLRPNNRLDEAETLTAIQQPDNVVTLDGALLFSSGNTVFRFPSDHKAGDGPQVLRQFEKPVTALAVSPDGVVAVGIEATGIRLVGGAQDGVLLEAPSGSRRGPTALAFVNADTLAVCIGSAQNEAADWQRDLMEMRATGSLWTLGLSSKTAICVADGLAFPNGVIVRGEKLVISESWSHRLLSFDMKTRKGRPQVILEDLPGYPGRLSEGRNGGAWLSVFAPRSQLIEFVLRERAYCGRMLREIPKELWIAPTLRAGTSFREPMQGGAVRVHGIFKPWAPTRSYGLAVELDRQLRPVRSFHSRADGNRHGITSLCQWRDAMVFSSRGDHVVGALPVSSDASGDAAR